MSITVESVAKVKSVEGWFVTETGLINDVMLSDERVEKLENRPGAWGVSYLVLLHATRTGSFPSSREEWTAALASLKEGPPMFPESLELYWQVRVGGAKHGEVELLSREAAIDVNDWDAVKANLTFDLGKAAQVMAVTGNGRVIVINADA